jgi:hypothetical protein
MRLVTSAVVLLATAVFVSTAEGSQLIDRNATAVTLQVDAKGEAMLTYAVAGKVKHVLAWGAVNARPPSRGGRQVSFSLDYSGGWGKYHTSNYWETADWVCLPYDGPPLAGKVAACKALDGSYWALQQWPQALPDLGYAPWTGAQQASWLELSHWSGNTIAKLTAYTDWIYDGRFQEVFGRLTLGGLPVYGFGTTRYGVPTDSFARLIYLDTYDSAYGGGWRRENSFVSHNPTGAYCYGFFQFDPTKGGYQHPPGQTSPRGPGVGSRYRLTVEGPGVTPNVEVEIAGLHPFDPHNAGDVDYQSRQTALLRTLGDQSCLTGHGV